MTELVAHVAGPLSGWYRFLIQCPPDGGDMRAAWKSAAPIPEGFDDRLRYLTEASSSFVDLISGLDLDAPTWALYATEPARFWALRTATETAVHLWDAQGAVGSARRLSADRAAVSVAETIGGMWPGLVRWKAHDGAFPEFPGCPDEPIGIRATDTGRAWRVDPGDGQPVAAESSELPPTAVKADGHDLVMYQWGRAPVSHLTVHGDQDLVDRWNLNLLATSFLGN